MPVEYGNGYEKLSGLTEKYPGKVDGYIMSRLTGLLPMVQNIDDVALPILMEVQEDSGISWSEYAEVIQIAGSLVAILATPGQIAQLMQMEEVFGLDLSRELSIPESNKYVR